MYEVGVFYLKRLVINLLMELENKLDRIIELLEKIESKISGNTVTEPTLTEIIKIKNSKPTGLQLKNQRAVEFANRQDSKQYLKTLKREIDRILEIQKSQPTWYPEFNPQSLKWFSKNFKNPNAPFYIKLKKEVEQFAQAVTNQGKHLIDQMKEELTN
jgi:hypothetical protein